LSLQLRHDEGHQSSDSFHADMFARRTPVREARASGSGLCIDRGKVTICTILAGEQERKSVDVAAKESKGGGSGQVVECVKVIRQKQKFQSRARSQSPSTRLIVAHLDLGHLVVAVPPLLHTTFGGNFDSHRKRHKGQQHRLLAEGQPLVRERRLRAAHNWAVVVMRIGRCSRRDYHGLVIEHAEEH
jgi:hypothetical protein